MSTFEFMNNPIMPGQPSGPVNQAQYQRPYTNYQQQGIGSAYVPQQPPIPPMKSDGKGLGLGFTVIPDEEVPDNGMILKDQLVKIPEPETKPRRGRPRKNDKEIVKGTVEDTSALYTYTQTTNMLHETVQQLDMVASEIKNELDAVRLSKTYKNKYNTVVGLAGSLGKLLETKVSAISQINNSISKANELDYKREKDRKTAEAAAGADDKYLMDLYNAFITNPNANSTASLGPNMITTTVHNMESPIIRSNIVSANSQNARMEDAGYLNYMSNLTPEQNMMYYESNPNIKTVVVYDAATGNKFFQVMDVSSGQVVPNVPVRDQSFMEDTVLDIKNKIARNNNLHETYPIIMINENIANEY